MKADLLYALRTLLKNSGFTAFVVFILALGIGANTAIFTVVDGVLLRPLPYADPGSLVLISSAQKDEPSFKGVFSYTRLQFLLAHSQSFSGLAGFTSEVFNISQGGDAEQLAAARVSWNFFDILGVHPELGRAFRPEEDRPGGPAVALISHLLWTNRFGASRAIIGQTVALDSRDYTIVGVLPAGFEFPSIGSNVDIWTPKVFELNIATPQQIYGGASFLSAVARLRPGVTVDEAQAEMNVLNLAYQRQNPGRPDSDPRQTINADDLQRELVADVRPALLILLGAVGFILLIACSNVASLLLSRALRRRKEIAIRAALGARRQTIVKQLLTESLLLAGAGGAAGILLSFWGTRGLGALTTVHVPRLAEVHTDGWVLAFTVAISVLSGVLFGLIPAWQLSRADLNSILRDEGRSSTATRERNKAKNLLVVAEVALSMVLLVGSGLLIRSFVRLATASPGFEPKGVLTMSLSLPPARYGKPAQMVDFYNRTLAAMQGAPAVEAVAISSALPVNPSRFSPVLLEGQPAVPIAQRPVLNIQTISPDYLKVLRIPLIRGREFTPHDGPQAPLVALVNQALVKRFWPNQNPVGKKIWLGRLTVATEVVGVMGDVKNTSLTADPQPEIFMPFPQRPWATLDLSVRGAGDPHALAGTVRQRIASVDRDQPVTAVQTMEEVLASARAQPRLTMLLLGLFSGTALVLAIAGIYGVISYSVAQRTHELGIRLALGATKRDIVRLVLKYGMSLAAAGIVIGLAGSYILTGLMSSLLYRITPTDPLTYVAGTILFACVAMLASYLPARRATRLDPVQALHHE